MRLLIYFDLPVSTKVERKQTHDFRKNLLSEGFIMMQYSCYSRFCRNDAECSKYFSRVKKLSNRLVGGEIRILKITNRQYENMLVLVKEPKLSEVKISKNPLIVF
ncbi:CRISPR-associated endonuclease Cas2 [Streptobacillus notomytis]|uniref:CRISPR-associated endonuclease Cas2 n=1 Tax=Streptobacillus notomytis TaxID=1712031 RepID=UPI000936D7E0|nr:CRISPR-associated endonuclease Cas2 [Streptobacillus notomytis]